MPILCVKMSRGKLRLLRFNSFRISTTIHTCHLRCTLWILLNRSRVRAPYATHSHTKLLDYIQQNEISCGQVYYTNIRLPAIIISCILYTSHARTYTLKNFEYCVLCLYLLDCVLRYSARERERQPTACHIL